MARLDSRESKTFMTCAPAQIHGVQNMPGQRQTALSGGAELACHIFPVSIGTHGLR